MFIQEIFIFDLHQESYHNYNQKLEKRVIYC